jgi:hypothetical protein
MLATNRVGMVSMVRGFRLPQHNMSVAQFMFYTPAPPSLAPIILRRGARGLQ